MTAVPLPAITDEYDLQDLPAGSCGCTSTMSGPKHGIRGAAGSSSGWSCFVRDPGSRPLTLRAIESDLSGQDGGPNLDRCEGQDRNGGSEVHF
jgi:hypothetical protein